MEKEIKEILETSMKDVIIESVSEIDIKGIFAAQIKKVTESIAREMFSEYGDFKKQLEKKVKSEININLDKLSVPNFGELAIGIVQDELLLIEKQESKDLASKVKDRLTKMIGVKSDEDLTFEKLADSFAVSMFKDEVKDMMDSCVCGEEQMPENLSDVTEIIEEQNLNCEFVFILSEKDRNWSGDWKAYTVHAELQFKKDDKVIAGLSFHIDRIRNDGENWNDDDRWREKVSNKYKIISLNINGLTVTSNGMLVQGELLAQHEKDAANYYLQGAILDGTDLNVFEIEQE